MSLEDQYDAWVRGLMGGGGYAATPKQAEDANDAVQQMQAQLDALTEAQKRQTAAGSALNAVQKAGAATAESVRRMSSELTKSLKQDGLLGGTVAAPSPAPAVPAKADFAGVTEKIKAQVLGQDAFVSALVKAFRRPFVLGTAQEADRARSVMLLCGPNGTGRHYALGCVVEELAARGILRSARIETLDLALYPGPAQEKLFLQDLYAALQSDAEVLAFEHYESCAANYLNMLSTLAMDGTLALSSRYVLQRGILVDVGTALAPGAIGELQAGGKYFVFYSNKGEAALADSCDHQPFIAKAPLVLVFMANFGHPITRTFASRYADTYTSLHDGGFALVVRSRADKLARSIGPDTLPYPLLCDAAGVLYEHLSIPTSKSTLMSYSLEGWRILREAKKQGYQPVKGAEQQLPLTLILDRDGTVLFCHYGASLTDVPEDCAAIQSLLEEMELTPGLEPEEDELPYEELQTAVAAESRPRSRHGRERPETTDEFRPIRPVRAYPESDLEKTSMFGLFDDPYDDK